MASSWIKPAMFLTLQCLIFLLNYPNQTTFTISNPPPETPAQHPQFNYSWPCCITVCPIKQRPHLESMTSVDLLCELVTFVVLSNQTETYCKSNQQCMVRFHVAWRLCADLSGKHDERDDLLRAVLDIVFKYTTTGGNPNEEQHPT